MPPPPATPPILIVDEHELVGTALLAPPCRIQVSRPAGWHRARDCPVIALLVDAPDLVRGPVLAAGASAVWPTATDPTDLAHRLHELTDGARGARR